MVTSPSAVESFFLQSPMTVILTPLIEGPIVTRYNIVMSHLFPNQDTNGSNWSSEERSPPWSMTSLTFLSSGLVEQAHLDAHDAKEYLLAESQASPVHRPAHVEQVPDGVLPLQDIHGLLVVPFEADAYHGDDSVSAGDVTETDDRGSGPPSYKHDVVVDVVGHGTDGKARCFQTFGQPSGVSPGTAALRCVDDGDHDA